MTPPQSKVQKSRYWRNSAGCATSYDHFYAGLRKRDHDSPKASLLMQTVFLFVLYLLR